MGAAMSLIDAMLVDFAVTNLNDLRLRFDQGRISRVQALAELNRILTRLTPVLRAADPELLQEVTRELNDLNSHLNPAMSTPVASTPSANYANSNDAISLSAVNDNQDDGIARCGICSEILTGGDLMADRITYCPSDIHIGISIPLYHRSRCALHPQCLHCSERRLQIATPDTLRRLGVTTYSDDFSSSMAHATNFDGPPDDDDANQLNTGDSNDAEYDAESALDDDTDQLTCDACSAPLTVDDFIAERVLCCPAIEHGLHYGKVARIHSGCGSRRACPFCHRYLSDDYIIHGEREVPQVQYIETWDDWKTSTAWDPSKAVAQSGMTCYAAAAATAACCRGIESTVDEFVHRYAYSGGALEDPDSNPEIIVAYRAAYERIEATLGGSPTMQQVLSRMEQDSAASEAISRIRNVFGSIYLGQVRGLDEKGIGTLVSATPGGCKDVIDRDGLFVVGENIHWKVVFAYQESDQGNMRVRYWDPFGYVREQIFVPNSDYDALAF